MRLFLFLALCAASAAVAGSAVQDDWSNGPDYLGPYTSWEDGVFWDCWNVDFFTGTGVGLLPGAVMYQIYMCVTDFSATAAGDFNADGYTDIAVCGYYNFHPTVYVLLNMNGMGTDWDSYPASTLRNLRDIKEADIDVDGDLDLLIAGRITNDVAWCRNNDGSGTSWTMFYIYESMGSANSVDAADLDGDGDPDVIATGYGIAWFENQGSGTTWVMHGLGTDTYWGGDACPVDIDGDGDLDIAQVTGNGDMVHWFENPSGSGVWALHSVAAFIDGSSLVSGDVDGDGNNDICATSYAGNKATWWRNADGVGLSWQEHNITADFVQPQDIDLCDIDFDSDPDFLVSGYSGIRWYDNVDGSGLNLLPHTVSVLSESRSARGADLNGSGRLDIAAIEAMYAIWYDLDARKNGWLESSILDTGCSPDWGEITWTGQTPSDAMLGFQVRASVSSSMPGAWSDTLWSPSVLHGVLSDSARFLQYRVVMSSSDPDSEPCLENVTVTWDPVGIGGGEAPSTFTLLPVSPNPHSGLVSATFSLASTETIVTRVFDISGRLVRVIGPEECEPGWQSIQLGEFSSGVYFIRLTSGEAEASERFVVIE